MPERLRQSLTTCHLFASSIVLIVPFIQVYTAGITDVNYIRYTFGYLIVISEFIWAIRLPYSSITLAAGHFKETRIGAWIEALSNIIISIFLVRKYGIIGVTIGTIFAMTIRTVEFVYHTNKYILDRSMWISFKNIALIAIETLLIIYLCNYLPYLENTGYINWIVNALMTSLLSIIIVMIFNITFFKKEFIELFKIFINVIRRKNEKN